MTVTPTKTYDVAHNPDDEEYMEFVLFMSRREYKTIQKRLDRGKKQAVVEGNFMGAYRPYGYDIIKTKTARTLTPNKDEAPIVKNIFLVLPVSIYLQTLKHVQHVQMDIIAQQAHIQKKQRTKD